MNVLLLLLSLYSLYLTQADLLNFAIKRQPLSYNSSEIAIHPGCAEIAGISANIRICQNTVAIFLPLLETVLFIEFIEKKLAMTLREAHTLVQGPEHIFAFQRGSLVFLLSVTKEKHTARAFQPMLAWTVEIDNMMFWNEFLILQEAHTCKFYAKSTDDIFNSIEGDYITFPYFNLKLSDCSKDTYTLIPSNKELLIYNTKLHELITVSPIYNTRAKKLEVRTSSVFHLTGLTDIERPVPEPYAWTYAFLMKQDLCSNFLSIFSRRNGHFYIFSINPYYLVERFFVTGRAWYGLSVGDEPGKCNAEQLTTLFYLAFENEGGMLDVRSILLSKKFIPGITDMNYLPKQKNSSHISRDFGKVIYFNPSLRMFQAQAIPRFVISPTGNQSSYDNTRLFDELTLNISLVQQFNEFSPCMSPWIPITNISEYSNLKYEKQPFKPFLRACILQHFEIYCQNTANLSPEEADFCTKCFQNYSSCETSCLGQYFERSCHIFGNSVIYARSDLQCSATSLTSRTPKDMLVLRVKKEFSEETECIFKSPAINSNHIIIRTRNFQVYPSGFVNVAFLNKTSVADQSLADRRPFQTMSPQTLIHSNYPSFYASLELKDVISFDIDIILMKTVPSPEFLFELNCLTCTTPNREYKLSNGESSVNASLGIEGSSEVIPRLLADKTGCVNGNWIDFERSLVWRNWTECPAKNDTEFCETVMNMHQGKISVISISLRPDYILPYCRLEWNLADPELVEVTFNLQPYEHLILKFSRSNAEPLTSQDASPKIFLFPSAEDKLNVTFNFYSQDPDSSLIKGGIKCIIKPKKVAPDPADQIIEILFLFLKLLVFFILVLNIVFFCARRNAFMNDFEVEDDEVVSQVNPYELIDYRYRPEKELTLTEDEKSILESEGFEFENNGTPTAVAEADCVICLERVEEEEYRVYLCGRHYVHIECFKVWIEKTLGMQTVQLCPMRCQKILLRARNSNASTEIESIFFFINNKGSNVNL